MIIRCPSCETCYDIADQSIGDEGRLVECVRCKHRWTARAESSPDGEMDADIAFDAVDETQTTDDQAFDAEPESFEQIDIDISDLQDIDPFADLDASQNEEKTPSRIAGSPVGVQTRKRIVVKRKTDKTSSPMQAFVLSLAIGMVGLGVWMREPIVRSMPQTAALYDLIGLPVNLTKLEFQDLTVSQNVENRADILVVKGRIANISDGAVFVPALRITLRSSDSLELFSWDKNLEFETLAPGSSAEFEAKLASPPLEAKDLTVRFVPRTQETVELRQ